MRGGVSNRNERRKRGHESVDGSGVSRGMFVAMSDGRVFDYYAGVDIAAAKGLRLK